MARPPRLSRAERKARTREELLRAASRLFLRNGYVATTVDDIASEAGVTTGAVYSNFATKEDVFLALVDELPNPDAAWITEETTAPDDVSAAVGETPEERAEALGLAMARLAPDRRVVSLLSELNAAAMRSDRTRLRIAEHNREFFAGLGASLAEVLDGDPDDAELLGLVAQSMYSGLVAYAAFRGEALPDEYFRRAYRLLAALANDRADLPT